MNPKFILTNSIVIAVAALTTMIVFEVRYENIQIPQTASEKTSSLSNSIPSDDHTQISNEIRRDLSLLIQRISSLEMENMQTLTNNGDIDYNNRETNDIHPDNNSTHITAEIKNATEERQKIITEAYYGNLDNHIEYETLDPEWASIAEDGIYNAMENQVFQGSEVTNLDCRSTLCRAEILHTSSNQMDKFNLEFSYQVSSVFSKSSSQYAEMEDGQYKTIVYLVKNGHNMPALMSY